MSARDIVCNGCLSHITSTVDEAKSKGWRLWLGCARCKSCGIEDAKNAGSPADKPPEPLTTEQIAKHRETLTEQVMEDLIDKSERLTRNLAIAFGLIGYDAEYREVIRMAERLRKMFLEGRR